eukprot:CAMPEP_0197426464 /NCGR_PEP_ID=MMETSP1170-20131217/34940_1 /TAXON_ID=54406 /ORGANISM="Sarcinochrysis sp, Strain CCMP770" /LENGTH=39 /DNA_ID= /DNA_START= /DNA_END= /DNA_ORIENTATION=
MTTDEQRPPSSHVIGQATITLGGKLQGHDVGRDVGRDVA